jgi:alkylhydroperoxidase family enzyme
MARIRLFDDAELDAESRTRVQAVEAAGADASVLRALAHRQDMFDRYFQFYYPAHQSGTVEPALKELVRLKIARLNDCFT